MMMSVCVYIFRRDHRLFDNTTFIKACDECKKNGWSILPLFIFNDLQVDPAKNAYFSNNQVQFMVQSLRDLEQQLAAHGGTLHFAHVVSADISALLELSKKTDVQMVAFNKDITPFALKRDNEIVEYSITPAFL